MESGARYPDRRKLLIAMGELGCDLVQEIENSVSYPIHRVLIDRIDSDSIQNAGGNVLILDSLEGKAHRGDFISVTHEIESLFPGLDPYLNGSAFVVLAAGLGGGVGSGGTVSLVHYIKSRGIRVLALVALPNREQHGRKRCLTADLAMAEITAKADGVLVLNAANHYNQSLSDSFADISEKFRLMMHMIFDESGESTVNLTYVCNVISKKGSAVLVTGKGKGVGRSLEAAQSVLDNPATAPFMEKPASGIVHILSSRDLTLMELSDAASLISDNWGDEIDLGFISSVAPQMDDELQFSLIIGPARQKVFRFTPPKSKKGADSLEAFPADSSRPFAQEEK